MTIFDEIALSGTNKIVWIDKLTEDEQLQLQAAGWRITEFHNDDVFLFYEVTK